MKVLWLQLRSRWAAFLHDFLCIPLAWLGAYWLRFNLGEIPAVILAHAFTTLPWVLFFQVLAYWAFGLYRGVWRFASIPDLNRIVKAVMMGSLLVLLTIFLLSRLQFVPRSVPPLYSMLLLLMLGGSRFLYRWCKDKPYFSENGERVLIVGAEFAGESLVRELLRDNKKEANPVAFVDDHAKHSGKELHGIRVVGTTEQIPEIVTSYKIDKILIALPYANAQEMRRIVSLCESTKKPVRTLPSMNDLVSGLVSVKNLREISLADLLGRDPVLLDWEAIENALKGQVVLISGGGGSIGAELCRQVMKLRIQLLIIVDHSEYNLFCIEQEFMRTFSASTVSMRCYLADICDPVAMQRIFDMHRPDVVFHAAAYKHVPLLEPQIRTAVKNNTLGTYVLAQMSVRFKIKKFVLVSSDKAVNPTNVMGATKRCAELVCQYFNDLYPSAFVTVRFGNVLGSRGSVVETFQTQLEKGGPLTVTSPKVMRYFMTIPEACQLILQAFSMGEGGELFVLDMGEPIKIAYLAEQMIRLSGRKKDEDIRIEYVGLRPGEKLSEELFHKNESLGRTQHTKILKARARTMDHLIFEARLKSLEIAVQQYDEEAIYRIIKECVPELMHELDGQSEAMALVDVEGV